MDMAPATFDLEAHVERLTRDGYTIIEDFADADQLAAARAALAPHMGTHHGRNDFEGLATERVYTLVARGKVFEDLTAEPRLLALLDRFLQPGYLLTASQAICIHPGEKAQALHFDDGFYRQPRPRPAISLSIIAAVDAFTDTNGATDIIPGSHTWGNEDIQALDPREVEALLRPVTMPAGGAIIFQGTLMHRGGANRSDAPRLAFTNQYCEPWARTQENFYLGVPRERVRAMSPRLQDLLGYNIWPPFMGQVTGSHPLKSLDDDWVAPVDRI
ncbi:phytanoyl-CoA dioxygenase family protein [Phenylobacterium sp.]|uniref:phytanoyl-CoA dioxygenase family protein n=1 Tax=Phenylobacterium sp. TaxID=1871053 RepID=UPI002736ECD2|nr:phytanoyl-CoA dioxygenase family protein [Phenylobacterium sp.]MDP3852912.1 phytanoyl-CoA dioxygenase family protein [Phenylobacterium sp.]